MGIDNTKEEVTRYGWRKAKGSCGYNVDGPVYAKMQGSIALFAWPDEKGFWTCAVTGVMSYGGHSLEECQIAGEKAADDSKRDERDSWISREDFDSIVANPTILGSMPRED